ncbi:hypothetical protein TNCV_2781291 [Trichonephila clavipes]|nr:hypothetical protein TNCV_2781291 [Trichonephila clavipes]
MTLKSLGTSVPGIRRAASLLKTPWPTPECPPSKLGWNRVKSYSHLCKPLATLSFVGFHLTPSIRYGDGVDLSRTDLLSQRSSDEDEKRRVQIRYAHQSEIFGGMQEAFPRGLEGWLER